MEIRNILNNNTLNINESNSPDKITPVKEEKIEKENIEVKDTIELSADENLINTRKAFDALNEASREMAKDKNDNIADTYAQSISFENTEDALDTQLIIMNLDDWFL